MTLKAFFTTPNHSKALQGPSNDELSQAAKMNMASLSCNSCGNKALTSQGVSDGKLRLKCKDCQKTSYAYKHSQVISIAKAIRSSSTEQHEPQFTSTTGETIHPIDDSVSQLSESENEEPLNTEPIHWENIPMEARTNFLYNELEDINKKFINLEAIQQISVGDIIKIKELLMNISQKINSLHYSSAKNNRRNPITSPMSHSEKPTPERQRPDSLQYTLSHQPNTWAAVAKTSHQLYALNSPNGNPTENSIEKGHKQYLSSLKTRKSNKIHNDLTIEQIENIKNGFSSRPISPIVTLHFEGMKRNRITEIKSVFRSIGIQPSWVRNISFIGKSIMELITFENKKIEIINLLEKYSINYMTNFNPKAPENIKNENINSTLTQKERELLAGTLHNNRLKKILERLPMTGVHNRLRNFLRKQIISNDIGSDADKHGKE
jgi:hypothetical protein